jgi:O-succinylbenzoate synthase
VPARTYEIGVRTRFRGITRRQGMVWRGEAGWAEWSPFLDYSGSELVPWLSAAQEAADVGWPEPLRDEVPVNCTVPAVDPDRAYALTATSGCRTAKVKVAEPGQSLAEDVARVRAVRSALGVGGLLRVDANGAWDVDQACGALLRLREFELEYAEQPCATVEQLADLRRRLARQGIDMPIAADESIRRSEDPLRVARLGAADIAVLKVAPLGGVRACLDIAQRIGMPVVVSSALETSVGIRAGLALAATLPELPYACGLNTVTLLDDDVAEAPLVARNGVLAVRNVEVSEHAWSRCAAPPEGDAFWQARLVQTRRLGSR